MMRLFEPGPEAIRRVNQDEQAATQVSEALLGRWVQAAQAQAAHLAGSEALSAGSVPVAHASSTRGVGMRPPRATQADRGSQYTS